jgi:hypothetical protein
MLANVGQEYPAKRIFGVGWKTHRTRDLISFLSILLEKHNVPPRRCAEVAGVVVGISRPGESVIRNVVPFFARDLASFATDANTRVGEEPDFDTILHVRMFSLIRALDSFADHRLSIFPCSP